MPCFPSLARAEKKLLRLAGEVARRAGGVSHPRIVPQRKQNGHYGRRKGNKRALWPSHGEQKGRYAPVGVSPPPPLRARPPARRDSSFRPALTADIQDSVLLNSFNSFFQMVLPPQECGLFRHYPVRGGMNPFRAGKINYFREVLYWQP